MALTLSGTTVSSNGVSISGSDFASRVDSATYNGDGSITLKASSIKPTNNNNSSYIKVQGQRKYFRAAATISGTYLYLDGSTLVGGIFNTDIVVSSGSIIYSDSTGSPAMSIPFPCTLTNYGVIVGKGGQGGSWGAGYNAGGALYLGASGIEVINYGMIMGGGGGGGSSNSGTSIGGGGGGAGGGNGGNGSSYPGGIGGGVNAAGSNPATIMVRNDGLSYGAEGQGGGAGGGGAGAYSSIHGGGGGGGRLFSNMYGGAGGAYFGGAGGANGNVGGNEGGNNDYRGGGGGGGFGANGGSAVGFAGFPGGAGGYAVSAPLGYTLTNYGTMYGSV